MPLNLSSKILDACMLINYRIHKREKKNDKKALCETSLYYQLFPAVCKLI